MAGMLRVPRSRGAIGGLLLVLLGIWGGLVIFVGPSLGYGYTPDRTWAYTTDRLYMVILPAAATFLGGLLTLVSANRATGVFGAWLAALGGAWFVVGGPLAPLWAGRAAPAGLPLGISATHRALEQIGIFTGLGVVIVFLAAASLGRFTVRGAREVAAAEAAGTMAEPAGTASTASAGGSGSTAESVGYHAGRTGSPDTPTTEFETPVAPDDTRVGSSPPEDRE